MRSKLNLTDKELMETPWISLRLQMMDYPYYSYTAKDKEVISDPQRASEVLAKYLK